MPHADDDLRFMREALRAAARAPGHRDVPVGAVIVRDGEVVSRAHNRREADSDPAGHAELIAIRRAARKLSSWRLDGCTIYVTLFPCNECTKLLIQSGIRRIVYLSDKYHDTDSACAARRMLDMVGIVYEPFRPAQERVTIDFAREAQDVTRI